MSKITPTERLISLVMLLVSSKRGHSKAEIFARVEPYRDASSAAAREKMFDRDKAVLRNVGIPLSLRENDSWGESPEAVYVIDQDAFTLEELAFTQQEAAALAAVRDFWGDGDFSQAARRALGRLDTAAAHQVLSEGPAGNTFQFTDALTDEASFAEIVEAIHRRSRIAFSYRTADGRDAERTISPWALIQQCGGWYVTGHDHQRDGRRNFKLTRIQRNRDNETSVREVDGDYRGTDSSLAELAEGMAPAHRYPQITLIAEPGDVELLRSRLYGEEFTVDQNRFTVANPHSRTLWSIFNDPDVPVRFSPSDHPLLDYFATRLRELMAAQDEAIANYGNHTSELSPVKSSRQRLSAADEMRLIFDIISYTVANDGATHQELQQRFGLTPKALQKQLARLPLYGLPQGGPDELFELNDDGESITVSQVDEVAKPLSLAPVEAVATMLGLQNLAKLREDIAPAAMGAYEKIRSALSARSYDSLTEFIWWDESSVSAVANQLGLINKAIDGRGALAIRYRSDAEPRTISPVQIRQFLADIYVLAWCHRANAPRVFKLSRCHSVTPAAAEALTEAQRRDVVGQDIFAAPPNSKHLTVFADYQIADQLPAMHPTHTLDLGHGDQLLRVPRVNDEFLIQSVMTYAPMLLVVEPADLVLKVKERILDRLELVTDERA